MDRNTALNSKVYGGRIKSEITDCSITSTKCVRPTVQVYINELYADPCNVYSFVTCSRPF